MLLLCFLFQAEDGIRDLVRSRGLGDVYKRQALGVAGGHAQRLQAEAGEERALRGIAVACGVVVDLEVGVEIGLLGLDELSLIHI